MGVEKRNDSPPVDRRAVADDAREEGRVEEADEEGLTTENAPPSSSSSAVRLSKGSRDGILGGMQRHNQQTENEKLEKYEET
jgi:hypothetical protein